MNRNDLVDIAAPTAAIALSCFVWAAVLLARAVGPSLVG